MATHTDELSEEARDDLTERRARSISGGTASAPRGSQRRCCGTTEVNSEHV